MRPSLNRILRIFTAILLMVSLFKPWLWRGYEPWSEFSQEYRKPIIHYHKIITITPIKIEVVEDGNLILSKWFYRVEMSIAGIGIITCSIICLINFNKWKLDFVGFLSWMFSLILFFLTLGGRGYGIGSITFLGLGLKIFLIGGFLLIIVILSSILRNL